MVLLLKAQKIGIYKTTLVLVLVLVCLVTDEKKLTIVASTTAINTQTARHDTS